MKTMIILLMTTICCLKTVTADCMSSNITFFPNIKTLTKDSIIVLQAFGLSQNVIPELNKKYNIILKSNNESVKLNIINKFKGDFNLSQILLKAEKSLVVGDIYELIFENSNNEPLLKNIKSSWQIVDNTNSPAPNWSLKPKEVEKSIVLYGCGPAVWVKFDSKINCNEFIMIKANVTSKEKNTTTSFLIPFEEDCLKIGHGMCGGGFTFDDAKEYTVTFDIMQYNGEFINWKDNPIVFISPN